MNIVDKLHANLNDATTSLAGINAFSLKDKIIVGLMILIPTILNNILYYYLQCVLLTQVIVVIVGYIVAPLVLRKIIQKDVYVLLDARESMSGTRPAIGWVWVVLALGIPVLFLIIGVWFDLLGLGSVTVMAPSFSRPVWTYVYLIFASIVFCVVHPYCEGRFYYGVIDSILPQNILGRVILAILLTANYIGFSFALLGTNYKVAVALAIFLASYFVLAYISLHKGVRVAIFMQIAASAVSWTLFVLFVVAKYNGSYSKGVLVNLVNPRNVLN